MFYITISNGLLEGDHRKRMGEAVWEFMWLIDKVTRIDEDGWGWVLGGKPINLSDIQSGILEKSVSRNLQKLKREGYILIRRTPHGIVIKVAKAKKRFNRSEESQRKDISEESQDILEESNIRQDSKTVSVDVITSNGEIEKNKQIAEVIKGFEPINPNTYRLYGMPPQRAAAGRMIEKHGFDKVMWAVGMACQTAGRKYMPTITTPVELEAKLGALLAGLRKESNTGPLLIRI